MKTNEKDTKQGVVPTLRFPEFQKSEKWGKTNLGAITYKINNKNRTGRLYPVYSINNKQGFIRQEDQFEGIDSSSRGYDLTLYNLVDNHTFAYNPARINVGSIGYSGELNDIIISSLYVCFKTRETVIDEFLLKYLDSELFNRAVINGVEGGIRSYLFYDNFARINLYVPSDPKEQQKIADCLSSIDALIKAAENKIDELKAHKKGLMEHLFPAEGKTVPVLRFPEFQNTKEWSVKKLNELASIIIKKNRQGYICKVLTNSAAEGVVDQSEYFDRNIVNQNNLQNYYVIENGDYVYNPRISTLAPVGPISKNLIGQGIMSPLYTIFRFMDNNNEFYNQYFKTTYWHKYLKDIANQGARFDRMSITADDFMNMPLPYPCPKEQQKIADCLSSIDDLITTQANRLEALKTHKKGLMQQLFPNINDTEA